MELTQFRANQRVPQSGIYRVIHSQHRLMHEATLVANENFPCCKRCGKSVKFILVRSVDEEKVLPFSSGAILEKCEQ